MTEDEMAIIIGEVLKEVRIQKGITIKDAAKKLKISPTIIEKAETGCNITFCEFYGLTEIYNVSPVEITSIIYDRMKKGGN